MSPNSGWLVLVGVAHHHRLALVDDDAVHDPGVVGGTGTAPAAGLDLQRRLCSSAISSIRFVPVEELTPEVGDQPEGVHVDLEVVDDRAPAGRTASTV